MAKKEREDKPKVSIEMQVLQLSREVKSLKNSIAITPKRLKSILDETLEEHSLKRDIYMIRAASITLVLLFLVQIILLLWLAE